jgi:hypothetical protein
MSAAQVAAALGEARAAAVRFGIPSATTVECSGSLVDLTTRATRTKCPVGGVFHNLEKTTMFVYSITAISRLSFRWAERQTGRWCKPTARNRLWKSHYARVSPGVTPEIEKPLADSRSGCAPAVKTPACVIPDDLSLPELRQSPNPADVTPAGPIALSSSADVRRAGALDIGERQ